MKSPLMIKWRYWNNSTVKAGRASNYLNYIGTRDGVEKLSEEKTYLDYIGTRPRVEKFGTNGLFSDEGESLVMETEREKLNQHQGRVSTLIISLSREDAEATGFNCAERWRAFMRTQKNVTNDHVLHLLLKELDLGKESEYSASRAKSLLFACLLFEENGRLLSRVKTPGGYSCAELDLIFDMSEIGEDDDWVSIYGYPHKIILIPKAYSEQFEDAKN